MKISLPKLIILKGQLRVLSAFHNPCRSDKRSICKETLFEHPSCSLFEQHSSRN